MANDRNAGRKPIPKGVRRNVTVPKDYMNEFDNFLKELQNKAINKSVKI